MEQIKSAFGTLNVYANRLHGYGGNTYHVSFVDHKNKAHFVLMHKSGAGWGIEKKSGIPEWVWDLEGQFSDLVKRQEKELMQVSAK